MLLFFMIQESRVSLCMLYSIGFRDVLLYALVLLLFVLKLFASNSPQLICFRVWVELVCATCWWSCESSKSMEKMSSFRISRNGLFDPPFQFFIIFILVFSLKSKA